MSDELLVLTFADKPLDEENQLRKSCEKFGIKWKAIIHSPWKQNVIKLKLLYEFVKEQDPELVVMVVDAYDVLVYDTSEAILKIFSEKKTDVLFSGESNFMFKDPDKWISYLRKYPRQSTIYQYVNSGTYIGKAKHLLALLEAIQTEFKIDLLDEERLLLIKSDQYLLSRFFVELSQRTTTDLNLGIDDNHALFGCTGGRFCVLKFPDLSKWQAFANFLIERSILLFVSLHRFQKRPKDYIFKEDRFFNKKMKTKPPIMHLPGTWDRFDAVLENLSKPNPTFSKKGKWIFAAGVSGLAFALSLVAGPLFWLVTRKIK